MTIFINCYNVGICGNGLIGVYQLLSISKSIKDVFLKEVVLINWKIFHHILIDFLSI